MKEVHVVYSWHLAASGNWYKLFDRSNLDMNHSLMLLIEHFVHWEFHTSLILFLHSAFGMTNNWLY